MAKSTKHYVVAKGRRVGIFSTWAECEAQVKGFSGARFKSFKALDSAQEYLAAHGTDSSTNDSSSTKWVNVSTVTTSALSAPTEFPAFKRIKIEPAVAYLPNSSDGSCGKVLRVHANFDGGSRGNPGCAGSGVAIRLNEVQQNCQRKSETASDGDGKASSTPHHDELFSTSIHLRHFVGNHATNNEAEYMGAVLAAEHSLLEIEKYRSDHPVGGPIPFRFVLQGDSDLIIQQLNGSYQCRHPRLLPFYRRVKKALEKIKTLEKGSVVCEHVYRADNKAADSLANQAMDGRRSWTTRKGDQGHDLF